MTRQPPEQATPEQATPEHAEGPVDHARLSALSSDDWAQILVATRAELRSRADLNLEQARLRDTPTGRLAAGPGRDAVMAALSQDAQLAAAVLARVSEELRATLGPSAVGDGAGPGLTSPSSAVERARAQEELDRARERARLLREERDTWQRRAEGADARAVRAEASLAATEQARQAAMQEVEELRASLGEAADAQERAVARERRRRESELARLERDNTALRRAEEERRAQARRQAAAAERRERPAPPDQDDEPLPRVLPGRPTRLPSELVPGTTPWARALLGPGRLVLIDGYNVTRQHRPDVDLAGQRAWLVRLLIGAAAVHRWRPVIVFDGQQAGGSRPSVARQQIEVRFTSAGITADDELVLAVEGTDEPVVVVTDDRELTERVRASDADVVGTTAFLSVARG